MKIGTSLGKCVKDILDGNVSFDDVLFITSGTAILTEEQLLDVLEQYRYDRRQAYDTSDHEWELVKQLGSNIWNSGILHQRRLAPAGYSLHLQDTWYDLMPGQVNNNESVQLAWDHYVMVSKLAR